MRISQVTLHRQHGTYGFPDVVARGSMPQPPRLSMQSRCDGMDLCVSSPCEAMLARDAMQFEVGALPVFPNAL